MSEEHRARIAWRRAERRHGLTGEPLVKGMLTGLPADYPPEERLASFLENALDARENGYDLVCAECGAGITDDSDLHERGCSHEGEDDETPDHFQGNLGANIAGGVVTEDDEDDE